jgi:hypothetical protein
MFASVLIVTRKNHCSLPVERSILIWYMLSANVLQQQQQHSLLSQASWGRLEMKPKRDEKQGDT